MQRVLISILFLSFTLLYGSEKATLNSDMTLTFQTLPTEVDSLNEMFGKGRFYGRVRINTFLYDADRLHREGRTLGTGGSLLYKSALYRGFGMTAGLYTSQNLFHVDHDAIATLGHTLSRYDLLREGRSGMTVLAQAFLEYRIQRGRIRIGRQLFESRLTASNDTKMIPNSFEGVSLTSSLLPRTSLKLAYLTAEKLRDHTAFHDPLSYDGYRENDDGAMHRGLTKAKLRAAGIDPRLVVAEAFTEPLDSLRLLVNYTGVPRLVHSMTFDAYYRIEHGGFAMTPGFRYMRQFDDGAGAIGGANLRVNTVGYRDPDSVTGALCAFRVDISKDAWRIRLGYSKVADKADLIAPWRGFPTGGFTRAMGQYNWYANTKTAMLRVGYDFAASGTIPGMTAFMRYALQDFDDTKPGVPADSSVVEGDLLKKFAAWPGLMLITAPTDNPKI